MKSRKSRSRSESDSDGSTSCHSETSRVSFDPAPSDTEGNNRYMFTILFGGKMTF